MRIFKKEIKLINSSLISAMVLLSSTELVHGLELAASDSYSDFEGLYGDAEFVSIATGSAKPISKAPAVASVITAEDIKAMGATDLDEVLESVPGLHTSYFMTSYNPIYIVRGIRSDGNPQVLMLINGIPITNLFFGDRGRFWAGMPVKAISRIEVIRGPGSALYGAEAFAGVINIVTKNEDDLEGLQAGVGGGSFGTGRGWVMYGGQWGEFESTVMLEVGSTDGQDSVVDADAQSYVDGVNGMVNPVSNAPDSVNLGRDNIDLRIDLAKDQWRFRGGYQGRFGIESGVGGGGALDSTSSMKSTRYNLDATYKDAERFENWDISLQVSMLHSAQEPEENFMMFPPGTDFTLLGGGPFPNGVIGGPSVSERHYRLSTSALYTGFYDHDVRVGAGWMKGDLYKVEDVRNFTSSALSGMPLPHPQGLIDATDTDDSFLPEKSRTLRYIFLQDEWRVNPDWEATIGVRYDDYSDFGNTVNPRAAIVWQTAYDLSTKFLYGRAFRAPAFGELFSHNNPVALGNEDLDPETIDTIELAFDYRPVGDWQGSLSLFNYQMKDIIQLVGTRMENEGRQKGRGFELEGKWDITSEVSLLGNFAFQQSTDEADDTDPGFSPHRQLYLRADWHFMPRWKLHGQVNWVSDRERDRDADPLKDDTRSQIDDYTIVNTTLRRTNGESAQWSMSFSVLNLFDEEAFEPAPSTQFIPGDLPLPERHYYAEVGYQF